MAKMAKKAIKFLIIDHFIVYALAFLENSAFQRGRQRRGGKIMGEKLFERKGQQTIDDCIGNEKQMLLNFSD